MKFYKIDSEIVATESSLSAGEELIPNTTDAAGEKHVPVVKIDGDKVVAAYEYCNLHGLWKNEL